MASIIADNIFKCRWAIMWLILGIYFLYTQRDSIGNLIVKITKIGFRKKGNGSIEVVATTTKETFPTQIERINDKEKFLKLEKILREKNFKLLTEEIIKWKKEDKKNIYPYIFQGRAYIEQGNYDLAKQEFNRALRIFPANSEVYYYLGSIPFRKNDLEVAKEYLDKAYSLDNTDPKITVSLAYISYYLEKNIDKSIEFINAAHDSYQSKVDKFPLSESLDLTIHQSMEYYLADRGTKEDFNRAFEIDKYIENKWTEFINKGCLTKKRIAFTLDTRGYLRYRAVEENYIPEKKKELIQSSIDFLTRAAELMPSDKEIVEHLLKAIKISNMIK